MMKLLSVERSIAIFDSSCYEPIEEVNLDITLDQLKDVVVPIEDDFELYTAYKLSIDQVIKLGAYLSKPISFSPEYLYFLQCFGNYDYT